MIYMITSHHFERSCLLRSMPITSNSSL